MGASFHGLRVAAFESRRRRELETLIRRHGGQPDVVAALKEVVLADHAPARDLLDRLELGHIDHLVLLTGAGIRALAHLDDRDWPRARIVRALGRTSLVARGPKPVQALRELGLTATVVAPSPHTWKEVLSELLRHGDLAGAHIAIQEYGLANRDLVAALEARGARVTSVPVYRWRVPDDTLPLRQAIGRIVGGQVDLVLFTNMMQVYNLFLVAAEDGQEEDLRDALGRTVISSIGPVCSEALRELGLEPDHESSLGRMGHMVGEAAQCAHQLVRAKCALDASPAVPHSAFPLGLGGADGP